MKVKTSIGTGYACWSISIGPDSAGNWRDDVMVTKATTSRRAEILGSSTGPMGAEEAREYAKAYRKAAEIAEAIGRGEEPKL